jgi:hypothetical protein
VWLEVGDLEKEEVGCALHSGKRRMGVSFSDHRPSSFFTSHHMDNQTGM